MSLVVDDPGPLSLVQDAGRPAMGHLGVSASGAFDRGALRQVNILLGNVPGAAAVEVLGGGLQLRAETPHVVAVTGCVGAITVDGRPAPFGRALHLGAGQRLRIAHPTVGLRGYLGVAGGVETTSELGSMSTDLLAGLGPAPLGAGDVLRVGTPGPSTPVEDVLPMTRAGDLTLDVVLGPRDDWFTAAAVRQLLDEAWTVDAASSRVGVRLGGPVIERRVTTELPSEPCVRGSIQVAADGQPIVLGPDHPVTGGYPVIAVVVDAHTDRLAQATPGQRLRLRRVPLP